ncbi:MAG: DUF262 domain-containing protein [Deltaproteobacteria bacterium]|nr:DUF262 domain-containing protein [Deltaproteobacteria bacterium]
MKISTILDQIDAGQLALPVPQRGYAWRREQVEALVASLYRRHPVGCLLVWTTGGAGARLLVDGQHRVAALYGIIRGRPPAGFEQEARAFSGLRFHLESEQLELLAPEAAPASARAPDPLWVDVSRLMEGGMGPVLAELSADPDLRPALADFAARLSRLLGIRDVDLHVEEIAGPDKSAQVVAEILARLNAAGTPSTPGDLGLARISAVWPEGRACMKEALGRWRAAGFRLKLDWLLENVAALATGHAGPSALGDLGAGGLAEALRRTERAVDYLLGAMVARLGLDHDRVLFGRHAFPILTSYVERRGGAIASPAERDRLLYWYLHSALAGRYSVGTRARLDRDLGLLAEHDDPEDALDRLIAELEHWRGGLRIEAAHFAGWSLGARSYPMLYLLSRMSGGRDWGTGAPLRRQDEPPSGTRLDVHRIFPMALLYERGHRRLEVDAVCNLCFLSGNTTPAPALQPGERPPEDYFPEIERRYPGALGSQWIPLDRELWKVDRYFDFLGERRRLLADAAGEFLDRLLYGEHAPDTGEPVVNMLATLPGIAPAPPKDRKALVLLALNDWVVAQGLAEGQHFHEIAHPKTGVPLAILDLCWPAGLIEGVTEPVAVLLDDSAEACAVASAHGYRCFTSPEAFKQHVQRDVLAWK